MRPEFGANLRELIFEGITEGSEDILQERITDQVAIEFPMVDVVSTTFLKSDDNNSINFILEYKVKNTGTIDELNIELNT